MQIVPLHQKVCRPVEAADIPRVIEVAREMLALVEQNDRCVGLAHSQVDDQDPLRLFVTREGYMINPVITRHTNSTTVEKEGCMSKNDGKDLIDKERWYKIEFDYQKIINGELSPVYQGAAKGFTARIIQHEIDHLNGICIFD